MGHYNHSLSVNAKKHGIKNLLIIGEQVAVNCMAQLVTEWGSQKSFLGYKRLKLKLRVFLASHIVAMVPF